MTLEGLKDLRDQDACRRAQVTKNYAVQPSGHPTNGISRDGQMPHLYTNYCPRCLEYVAMSHPEPCGNPQQTFEGLAKKIIAGAA